MGFVPPEANKANQQEEKKPSGFTPPEVKKKEVTATPSTPSPTTSTTPVGRSFASVTTGAKSALASTPSAVSLPNFIYNNNLNTGARPTGRGYDYTGPKPVDDRPTSVKSLDYIPDWIEASGLIGGGPAVIKNIAAPEISDYNSRVQSYESDRLVAHKIEFAKINSEQADIRSRTPGTVEYQQKLSQQFPGVAVAPEVTQEKPLDEIKRFNDFYLLNTNPAAYNDIKNKVSYYSDPNRDASGFWEKTASIIIPAQAVVSDYLRPLMLQSAKAEEDLIAINTYSKATNKSLEINKKLFDESYGPQQLAYEDAYKNLQSWPKGNDGEYIVATNEEANKVNGWINTINTLRSDEGFMSSAQAVYSDEQDLGKAQSAIKQTILDNPLYFIAQNQAKQRKVQTEEDLKALGPVFEWKAKNIDNPATTALVDFAIGIAYLPKALGEGDEFGWTDDLYNQAATSRDVYITPYLPVEDSIVSKIVSSATTMALMVATGYAGGAAIGGSSMAMMAGQAAAGTVSTMEGFYRAGKEAGMSDSDAENYSIVSGLVQGMLEMVNPEAAFGTGVATRSANKYIQVLAEGGTKSFARKEATRELFRNVVGENVQELLQQTAEWGINMKANQITGANLDVGDKFGDVIIETAIITTLVSGVVGGVQGASSSNRIQHEAIYATGLKPEIYKSRVADMVVKGQITQEKAAEITAKIDDAQKVVSKIPSNISPEKAVQLIPKIQEKIRLEDELSKSDDSLKPAVEEQIAAVSEEIRQDAGIKTAEEKAVEDQEKLVQEKEIADLNMLSTMGVITPEQQTRLNELNAKAAMAPAEATGVETKTTTDATQERIIEESRKQQYQDVEEGGLPPEASRRDITEQGGKVEEEKVSSKTTPVEEAAAAVQRSLESAGITVRTLTEEEAVAEGYSDRTQGMFEDKKGQIVVVPSRIQEGWGTTVVWHEGAHPVLNIVRNTDKPTYDAMVRGLKNLAQNATGKNKAQLDDVVKFAEEYRAERGQEGVDDESIAEFTGRVGSGMIDIDSLPKSFKQKFVDFINSMATKLGLGTVMKDTDAQTLINKAKEISDVLKSGRDIAEVVGAENVKKFEAGEKLTGQERAIDVFEGILDTIGISVGTVNEKTGKRKVTNFDVAKALNEYYKKNFKKIKVGDFGKGALNIVSDYAADEVIFAISKFGNNSGKGWYTVDFEKALNTMKAFDKDIVSDPKIKDIATVVIAIASNSTDVYTNLGRVIYAVDTFKSTGKIPTDVGVGKGMSAIAKSIDTYNKLLDVFGNVNDLKNFMSVVRPISESKKALMDKVGASNWTQVKAMGIATDPEWNKNESLPTSVILFGPKIGAFWSNLSGLGGTPTIDRWCIRTMYRYMGDMKAKALPSEINDFMKSNSLEGQSKGSVISLIQDHAKMFDAILVGRGEYAGQTKEQRNERLKPYRKGSQIWTKMTGVVNEIEDGLTEKIENKAEYARSFRSFTKKAFEEVQRKVKDRTGQELEISDIQAILWIFEKELFGAMGVKQRPESTYSASAQRLVNELNSGKFTIDQLKKGKITDAENVVDAEGSMGDIYGVPVNSFESGLANQSERIQEEAPTKKGQESRGKRMDVIADTYVQSGLTEDGNDYIFFHVSSADEKSIRKGIDSRKFYSTRTSKSEKGTQYGVASYYTKPTDGERMVGGDKYVVRVSKDKVYPMDIDPKGYKDQVEKTVPENTPFRAEVIKKKMTDLAAKDGYQMAVGEWYYSRTGEKTEMPEFRADALVALKPTNESASDFVSNEESGMERIAHPEEAKYKYAAQYEALGEAAYDYLSEKGRYDDAYDIARDMYMYGKVPTEQEMKTLMKGMPKKISNMAPKTGQQSMGQRINNLAPQAGSVDVGGYETFYTGRGKKYDDLKNTKGEFIFFSKDPKISEWYGGGESNVTEAKLDTSDFLDLTTQESKAKFVKEHFTDKDIEKLYSAEIKYEEDTDRFGRKTRESLIKKYRERAEENRFSGDGKEQQFLLKKIKEQGHSGVKLLDTHFGKSDISYVVIDKSKIEQSLKETPKFDSNMAPKTGQQSMGQRMNVAGIEYTELSIAAQETLRARRSKKSYFDDAVSKMPKSDFDKDEVERIIKEENFGIITGENPMGTPTVSSVNSKLNGKAVKWLESRGYEVAPVTGKYGQTENSFFVPGLTVADAVEFAKAFNQDSVVTNEGMVYQDGRMNPRTMNDSFNVDSSSPTEDFVSAIRTEDGNVMGFKIGIDLETKVDSSYVAQSAVDTKSTEYAKSSVDKAISERADAKVQDDADTLSAINTTAEEAKSSSIINGPTKISQLKDQVVKAVEDGLISDATAKKVVDDAIKSYDEKVAASKESIKEAIDKAKDVISKFLFNPEGQYVTNPETGEKVKISKSSIFDVEATVNFATDAIKKAVDKGVDLAVALGNFKSALSNHPTIKNNIANNVITEGEFEAMLDAEIAKLTQLYNNLNNKKTEKASKTLDRVMRSNFVSQDIKDSLESQGITYVPDTISASVSDAQAIVDYFDAEGALDILEENMANVAKSPDVMPHTRALILAEIFDKRLKVADDVANDPSSSDQAKKAAADKAANTAIAFSTINGQYAKSVSIASKRMKEIVGMSAKGLEYFVDAQVKMKSKNFVKSNRMQRKAKKAMVNAAKTGNASDSKKSIMDSLMPEYSKLDDKFKTAIDANLSNAINSNGQINKKDLENALVAYYSGMQMSEDLKKSILSHTAAIKDMEGKQKSFSKIIEEYKSALSGLDPGTPAYKAVVDKYEKMAEDAAEAVRDADFKARLEAEIMGRKMREGRDLWQSLASIMKLNMLTPQTIIVNIVGYLPAIALRGAAVTIATPIDWSITMAMKATRSITGNKTEVSRTTRVVRDTFGGIKYGFAYGAKEGFRKIVYGSTSEDVEKYNMKHSMNAFQAWRDLFSKKSPVELNNVENKISAFIEATFGMPADAMSRMLSIGDKIPFEISKASKLSSLANETYVKNKDGSQRKMNNAERLEFIFNPPAEAAQIANDFAEKMTYQQKNVLSDMVNKAQKNIANDVSGFIEGPLGRHISGFANLLIGTVIPFTKTPVNLLTETFMFTNPALGVVYSAGYAAKSVKEERAGNEFKASYYRGESIRYFSRATVAMGVAMVAANMIKNGLMTGDEDEMKFDAKSMQYENVRARSLNLSALFRMNTGDSNWAEFRKGDFMINYSKLGTLGLGLSAWADFYRDKDANQIDGGLNDIMSLEGLGGISLANIKAMVDQSFMTGIAGVIDAIRDDQGNKVKKFQTNTVVGLSKIFIPNTVSAVSKASMDFTKETRTEGKDTELSDMIMNRLRVDLGITGSADELPSKITLWGEPVKSSPAGTNPWVYYLFDPVQSYSPDTESVGFKIQQSYFATPKSMSNVRNKMIPSKPDQTISINNSNVMLTGSEYEQYQILVGKTRKSMVSSYVNSDLWNQSSLEQRAEVLDSLYSQAAKIARVQFIMNTPRLMDINMGVK